MLNLVVRIVIAKFWKVGGGFNGISGHDVAVCQQNVGHTVASVMFRHVVHRNYMLFCNMLFEIHVWTPLF